MTLTWRRDKSSPITATEHDGNIDEIAAVKVRVTTLEGETLVSIVDITRSGNVMTIHLSNSTTVSLTLPVFDINDRGQWAPLTNYAKDDFFDDNNGGWFRVLLDHTSAATFNEFANDGAGHNYYRRLVTSPGNSFPGGGVLGQVIMKLSATEQDKGWRFLPAIYVAFDPSSDSDLISTTVADALEELERKIGSAIGAIGADDVAFSADSDSGLSATTVGEALNELGGRSTAFSDLSGHITAVQSRDGTVTGLGTTGSVSLDPALGDLFTLTPSGDVTLNATSAPANARIVLLVTTSGASSFNITFGSNFKSSGVLATGTEAGKTYAVSFVGGSGGSLIEMSRTAAL